MTNATQKRAVAAKAAQQASDRERTQALRRILEDCAELKKTNECFTHREVEALRQAFKNVMRGQDQHTWNNQATQCDNVLWQLEKEVLDNPEAHTGDAEHRELKGAETWKFTKIPRRRRLQTLAVSLISFFTGMPLFLCLAFFLTFYSYYTMVPMVFYWLRVFWPVRHPLPKRMWFVRTRIFKLFRDYFPIRLVIPKAVRKAITPTRNYMFCYHPHGVASVGVLPSFATEGCNLAEMLPGIDVHVQTLGINFIIPFWRELIIWSGMGDASAAVIRRTLNGPPGRSVLLVVGGAEEALLASPRTNRLTLSKRKGFVKLALERGAPLVPIYGFGENNVYGNYADGRPWLQSILLKMQKKLGFAIPLVKGRGWFNYNFGPIPHRRQIIVVVGAPVELPKIESPTKEDVEHWHKQYCDALLQLYHENRPVYDVYTDQGAAIVK